MCKPKAVAGKSPDEPAVQRAVDLKGVPRDYSHASLTVSPGTTGMSVQRAVSLTSGSCYSSEAMVFFFSFPVLVHEPGLLCAWVSAFLGFPCSPCPPSLKM